MIDDMDKVKKNRPNDFPELQIGYPERNDVRDPNGEMERIHVNLENFELQEQRLIRLSETTTPAEIIITRAENIS